MKAKVKKTGEIVELCDKQQEYFISTDSTPYKEEELEFGVGKQKSERTNNDDGDDNGLNVRQILFPSLSDALFQESDSATTIAVAYIEHRKDLSPQEIEDAVVSIMIKLKTLDSI